jgi:hypothetical protein
MIIQQKWYEIYKRWEILIKIRFPHALMITGIKPCDICRKKACASIVWGQLGGRDASAPKAGEKP